MRWLAMWRGENAGRGCVIRAARGGVAVVGDNGCERLVEGAADAEGAAVEDVGVDHGGGDVAVAEELLDSANVVAGLEEVGGEGVAEGVAAGRLGDFGGLAGRVEGTLEHGFVQVVAPQLAARVAVVARGRKDPLPGPFTLGEGKFVNERSWQLDVACAFCEVGLSCCRCTVSRCARRGAHRRVGRSVSRSFPPLPLRTMSWFMLKSTSLIRRFAHSSSRNPEP